MVMQQRYTDKELELFRRMRVVILSPVMHSEPKFWKSVVNLVAFSWHHGLRVEEMGITERAVVDWARNDLARAALEKTSDYSGELYTHFLWLDSDHVFNPDMLCELAKHDKEAMSALYFNRSEPFLPVVYIKDHSDDAFKHFPLIGVPPSICAVDAVGFGALLMRREVMEKVPQPWFTIDYRAGEDIAFCTKAREYGIQWYVNGAYKLGHIAAPQIITEKDYLKYQEDHKDEFEDKVKISLGGQGNGK
jgi:hypothetical protein